MKTPRLLLALALLLRAFWPELACAAMHTPADITGANVVVQLSASNIPISAIQIIVTGSGTVRFGDSNTNSSQGLPLSAGQGEYHASGNALPDQFLSGLYVYVPTGATVSFAYYD